MIEEILRVAYFPSTSLIQILDNMSDSKSVIEINARRRTLPTKEISKAVSSGLPFIKKREVTMAEARMSFRGRFRALVKHEYGVFPEAQVRDFLKNHEFLDMQVNNITILCTDTEIWDLLKNRGKSISLTKKEQSVILTFRSNPVAGRQTYVRRRVYGLMKNLIEKLGFTPATLDLVGIETYPDWKYQIKNNLFGINWDKGMLKTIMTSVFNSPIYVRSYKLSESKKWELINDEKL